MAFIPLAESSSTKGGFTPLEQKDDAAPKSNTVLGTIRSALQGMTLGWSDELGVGIAAAMAKATGDDKDIGKIYDEMMQSYNKEQGQFEKEHPALSTTAEIIGGVATGGAGAGKTAALQGGKRLAALAGQGAAIGGVAGAGYAEEGQRLEGALKGAGTGALIGAATGKLEGSAKKFLDKIALKRAQNAVKNQTLLSSREAGYVVPPSQGVESGITSRIMEGVSGKYKTNQLAGIRNQRTTDNLIRKALNLPDDAPITTETLQAIRNEAVDQGYEPVKAVGNIVTDVKYRKALSDILKRYQGPAKSFPGVAKNDVKELIDGFKIGQFDSNDAVSTIKLLRDEAGDAFRTGNTRMGKASRELANSIEDQIERSLSSSGGENAALLNNFRQARTLIAKTHSVEKALNPATGSVDAIKLAAELRKGKPLSGEIKKAAKFGQAFPDVARMPRSGDANPFTIADIAYGIAGAGINPAMTTLPLARLGSRQAILSQPFQNALVRPQQYRIANTLANPYLQGTAANLMAMQAAQ